MLCRLLSPTGVLFEVREEDLSRWCLRHDLSSSNVRKLCGLHAGDGTIKHHEQHWVHYDAIKWLQNSAIAEPLFTVGATTGRDAGKLFLETIACRRTDMPFNRKQFSKLLAGELDVLPNDWRIVPPPPDAAALIRRNGLRLHLQVCTPLVVCNAFKIQMRAQVTSGSG